MTLFSVFVSLLLLASVITNIIFVWYTRSLLRKCFFASEAASGIFSRFDAYKTHLKSVYELELFYGDKNLKDVIEHTTDIINYLKQFDGVYSFTQPEIEEILKEEDLTEDDREEETQTEKIFYGRSRTSGH